MFKVSKNKSRVSWRHFSSHCGSSFLSVKLTVKIENISFKNNFHGFKNKFFRKAMLYNVSFIFQPKCYCRNSQIVRNICIKTYNIKTDEFRIWIYGRRQILPGKYIQVLSISHKMADYFAFPLLF